MKKNIANKKKVKKYPKGVRLERKITNFARERGFVAYRSAGSKSGKTKIDVTIIDPFTKTIWFVQAKASKISNNAKSKIEDGLPANDEYIVKSIAVDKNNIKEFLKELKEIRETNKKNAEGLHTLFDETTTTEK